jgi:hypothetical protein
MRFPATSKAQRSIPPAVQDLTGKLASVRQELALERAATAVLRRNCRGTALELDQGRSGRQDSRTPEPRHQG